MTVEPFISHECSQGAFVLARQGWTIPLLVDPADDPGVLRAVWDVAADFGRVTGTRAGIIEVPDRATVLVGTLGQSRWIDRLAADGCLPGLAGHWEGYLIRTVDHPFKGLDRALVVAGSDRRGTIFGLYQLAAAIGVSPWHWWADVPVRRSSTLAAAAGTWVFRAPAVKYRGIFLNDEYPALTRWVAAKFGMVKPQAEPPIPQDVTNYGREFYTKIFELLLRLGANTLWPAMWNNAFNEDDPENARLAHEWGIVMGTSHQEPMMRAQKEWDRRYSKTVGSWNYAKVPEIVEEFWREGIERNQGYDNLVTLGLRGADDTEMAPGGPTANKALLETIVERQRQILTEVMGRPASAIPQVWALYKEVVEYYNAGMRVPDDVILLWGEDNWGNLRRVPTPEERKRSGGAGIYYHFDYHGGPRSYQWINTSPIAKIWDQMTLARQFGADRLWIVNVGHLKGYEYPLSFFLDMAWNPDRYHAATVPQFTRRWAASLWGPEVASEAAELLETLARYHGRVKPELLAADTFHPVHFQEAQRVLAQWKRLEGRAEALGRRLPEAADAFYQLVLFPARASALLYEIYTAAGRNQTYAAQGRVEANAEAERARQAFSQFQALVDHYNNEFAGGKWSRFMDQAVLGYQAWNDPPHNSLDHLTLRAVTPGTSVTPALVVENDGRCWTGPGAVLPALDTLGNSGRRVELVNLGTGAFGWSAVSDPWITIEPSSALVTGATSAATITCQWDWVPEGVDASTVVFRVPGGEIPVEVPLVRPSVPAEFEGFVEVDRWLSIEAVHWSANRAGPSAAWQRLEGYGAIGSAMRAAGAPDAGPLEAPEAPCLEYRVWVCHGGPATVELVLSPALNVLPDRPVRIGFSLDQGAVDVATVVPGNYLVSNENADWNRAVATERRCVRFSFPLEPGEHTLKVWMVDPMLVLTRFTVDIGGLKPTYLGPPESYFQRR